MTDKEAKKRLALIKAGIKEFPKVLARKEKAFQEKKKRMKAFESLSRSLFRQEKKIKKA